MAVGKEKIHLVTIPENLAGVRLDKALATLLPDLSRTRLKALMLDRRVDLAGVIITDPARPVAAGEAFQITEPEAEDPVPQGENIPLAILFEDDDMIIVDIPAGLVVHPAPGPVLANYGLDNLRFTEPVYIGDTIYVKLTCKRKTVKQKREEDDIPQGIVEWDVEVINQDEVTVAVYTILTLVQKKEEE